MANEETPKFNGVWHGAVFKDGRSDGIQPRIKEGFEHEANELFRELYGVPFKDALILSKMNGPTGEHWRGVLNHLNDLTPEEMTPKTDILTDGE